jgi:inosine-uridine nucleoside N-ribohydrolase/formylmethanofuran dehydrogenase subunit E
MRIAVILLLEVIFMSTADSQPLPVVLKQNVIIDSDCAIDDMRAISVLLSRPEITVKAILVSDGSLPPNEGVEKIRSLLHEFNRDSIPVASGDELKGVNPPWRPFNRQVSWGAESGSKVTAPKAVECLLKVLKTEKEKITLLCLGPLTDIAHLIINDITSLSKLDRIIWYNESVAPLQGFNYECDTSSAALVFKSGLKIVVLSNLKKERARFDTAMYSICRQSNTLFATVLNNVYRQPEVLDQLRQNHFRLSDDLVALYITNPELFDITTMKDNIKIRFNKDYDIQGIREVLYDMMRGTYVSEHNVVFNRFPDQREMFNYDVRPIMDSAIELYGPDEWKANVMTDEFHGHLGVFSIVGAKMGIRAREYFGVGPDMLNVVTYAGSKPPYSCLNDGIQVSTGATLGMGTIHLATDSITKPSAIFTYKGHSIRITLKREYLDKVDADINEGIVKFGLMDDGYWKLIRRNALKYWLEWDRYKIFDVVEIQ